MRFGWMHVGHNPLVGHLPPVDPATARAVMNAPNPAVPHQPLDHSFVNASEHRDLVAKHGRLIAAYDTARRALQAKTLECAMWQERAERAEHDLNPPAA